MSIMNYAEINYDKNMKILSHAIDFCESDLSHNDIINVLQSDDDIQKQYALIELKTLNNQQETNILISNLTNNSGPVRETCSYKILDLIKQNEYTKYFQTQEIIERFVKAITDINPSVSRNAVEFIKYIEDVSYLYKKIIKEIKVTLSQTDIDAKNRSYVQNKKDFNLYWNLEAIISISDKITPDEELFNIIKEISTATNYTIREKAAKAAKIFSYKNDSFSDILKFLSNDENIYVRNYTNN